MTDTAMLDIVCQRSARQSIKILVAIASITVGSLAGCSSHKGPSGSTRAPHPTGTPSIISPSPTDTKIVSNVPSIVPLVNAVLNKQGIDLPLERDKGECHPNQSSHTGLSGNISQTCRWHPDEAGSSSYRILSVDLQVNDDPLEAHRQFVDGDTQSIEPKSVAIGNEAIEGGIQFTETAIKVQGRYQSLASSGIKLHIRVHNIIINIVWAGANFTIGPDGVLTHIVGLSRDSASRQPTIIAKAIVSHLQ